MNAIEIYNTILLNNQVSDKDHCNRLATAYQFFKSTKKDIVKVGFAARNIEMMFGKRTETKFNYDKKIWETRVLSEGQPVKANVIKVTTKTGTYCLPVPIGNDFYTEICALLDLPCVPVSKPEIKALKNIIIDSSVIESILKAAKFTDKDKSNLRPQFECVCLHFENNKCEVVGTNAHYIYVSKLLRAYSGKKPFELLISPESLKAIGTIKIKESEVLIQVISKHKAILSGIEINLESECKFPNYKVVIEDYATKMIFDREKLISAVKICEPFANKATKQVNFHLNGKIELHSQDIDFSFERDTDIPYISKDFPDMDTAFNAEILRTCLSVFKDKEIEMYSEGNGKRMSIFTNGIDRACIMPLMLHN